MITYRINVNKNNYEERELLKKDDGKDVRSIVISGAHGQKFDGREARELIKDRLFNEALMGSDEQTNNEYGYSVVIALMTYVPEEDQTAQFLLSLLQNRIAKYGEEDRVVRDFKYGGGFRYGVGWSHYRAYDDLEAMQSLLVDYNIELVNKGGKLSGIKGEELHTSSAGDKRMEGLRYLAEQERIAMQTAAAAQEENI